MATKQKAVPIEVNPTQPTPASAPATGPITLPELPPAETFVGLVAYGVDTTTNESRHIPLEFLGRGVQACIDATQASTEQTEQAKTATTNADTATTGANEAAGTARNEAANLSALKETVAGATADAIEKTEAAETATGAANTATTNANEATADAIEKAEAATTAAEEANAAKDAAIEATANLTADVSALVLTDENKLLIQELAGDLPALASGRIAAKVRGVDDLGQSVNLTPAQIATMSGIDYSKLEEQAVPGEFWLGSDGKRRQVYTRTFQGAKSPTAFPQGIASQVYSYAWSFYQIGSINACHLIYASIGSNDFFDPATGEINYIWRGLDLWFKNGLNAKFNNVSYVLTFKFTKP